MEPSVFGMAVCKRQGEKMKIDESQPDSLEPKIKTTWFEFNVPDYRIQEVVDHLAKIGIECDPRLY